MSSGGRLAVFAHGMVTAVASNGAATSAAMRAGVSGVAVANLWDKTAGQRLNAARPKMQQWWEGPGMLAPLAQAAIEECLGAAAELAPGEPGGGAQLEPDRVPILLILPPPDRPLRPAGLEGIVTEDLRQRLGRALPPGSSVISSGRTGIAQALLAAHELLSGGRCKACVIVGVESFLRQAIVNHYIDVGRLLCGTQSNGFIPGEAACAVLVGLGEAFEAPKLMISSIGRGVEPGGAGGSAASPVTGNGLTAAIREALTLAGIEYYHLQFLISDVNGERFKFKEATIAAGRLDRPAPAGVPPRPLGHMQIWQPAEFLGEIGAAIFPCLLGWAFEAGREAYAPSERVLLYAGEDNGDRVAIVGHFVRGVG